MLEKGIEGKYSCPNFPKKYMCKHVVGLAIRFKYTKERENDQKNQQKRLSLIS